MPSDRKQDRHLARKLRPVLTPDCGICGSPFGTTDGRRKRCDVCKGNHAAWEKVKRDANRNSAPATGELTCSSCKERKPVSEFYRNRTSTTGYQSHCKSCHNVPTENKRRNKYWTDYRLRWDDVEALLAKQGDKCAVCSVDLTQRNMRVDHDHACDHLSKGSQSCRACVRGLLCPGCNTFLGFLEARQHLLERALAYVAGSDWTNIEAGTIIRIPFS